jgi:hypothetical protein
LSLRSDDYIGLDSPTRPVVGESIRPVVASLLQGSRRAAPVAAPCTSFNDDFWRPSKLAGACHQHPIVQTALAHILNQAETAWSLFFILNPSETKRCLVPKSLQSPISKLRRRLPVNSPSDPCFPHAVGRLRMEKTK